LWLMERILSYARKQGYVKYTSTLVEAWRVSIKGLSDAIVEACAAYGGELPEFLPDEEFEDDPVVRFGVQESRLHRERGISLSMFLGLYKYYRYTFEDFVKAMDVAAPRKEFYHRFVERCFDRIEIAFCNQWSSLNKDNAMAELQEANRLMTNEKNKYLTLFESLEMPTFLIDENGFLENLNAPAFNLIGRELADDSMYYSRNRQKSHKARHISELLSWLKSPLGQFLGDDQRSCCFELEERNEPECRSFRVSLSRMRDVSGKFGGGVIVLEDITERRHMERLKEDVERITRHDLKIPLSGMLLAFNYLLSEDNITEEQREMLSMARDSGYTMLDMINRSLDLYKIESGTYQFEPTIVGLQAVLGRVLDHCSELSTKHGVMFSLDIQEGGNDGQGAMLLADDMLLYAALGNLIKNAVEASPPGKPVSIAVTMRSTCHITISNEGGVPESFRASFFDKYSTLGKKNGSGLGTYSARLFVETMGGTISLCADDHKTDVILKLPLAT